MLKLTDNLLYGLLPSIYRSQDEKNGNVLRSLFAIFEQELQTAQHEISQAYANSFIETCEPWVLPLIGNLLGISNLSDKTLLLPELRSFIANTLFYRSHKGKKSILQQMATEATKWPACVIEYTPLISIMQNMQSINLNQGKLFDVRKPTGKEDINSFVDTNSHTIDIRNLERHSTKYNLNNLGVFIWRLSSYLINSVTPKLVFEQSGYTFDPLGIEGPLFINAATGNLPAPIQANALRYDIAKNGAKFELQKSFSIVKFTDNLNASVPVQYSEILVMDLNNWDIPIPADKVAIDPHLGRFVLGANHLINLKKIEVNYCYGSNPNLGAGNYEQADNLNSMDTLATNKMLSIKINSVDDLAVMIQNALNTITTQTTLHISIANNSTYNLTNTILSINNSLQTIIIAAESGFRPCLQISNNLKIQSASNELKFALHGLYIEGTIELQGKIKFDITNCTLVPNKDTPSVQMHAVDYDSSVTIENSIVGALYLSEDLATLNISDSIIDGLQSTAIAANADASLPGPSLYVERSTIFGSVFVTEINEISESIITKTVTVNRTQYGCVRYSYLPLNSATPGRYRCQPELALEVLAQEYATSKAINFKSIYKLASYDTDWYKFVLSKLSPIFKSTSYNNPHYGMLSEQTDINIRRGAENNLEMGVFNQLNQPLREDLLQDILNEYVPFHLTGQKYFVT